MSQKHKFTSKQLVFQEIVLGVLIYAVVLGFFNDYTSIVYAKSFSTLFFASLLLELLTYYTFQLKKKLVSWVKRKKLKSARLFTVFSIWLIMFSSKFVFIWALDFVFGSYITVNGFFGILFVVLSVTIFHKLVYLAFRSLGDEDPATK
jgi:hypothetical protein